MFFHRSLALLLLGLVTVTGQEDAIPPVVPPVIPPAPPALEPPPPPPPGVPIPGVIPAAPAGAPAAAQPSPAPSVSLGQTKIIADINEPKLSGTALAGLYRKYTGKRVIVSAAAATAEFSFVQEATPQDPLTFAEAAELLRKAATIENFVFVPDAEDPNLDILTLSTGGLRPTGRGVAVYNENDTLPAGDAVISYVMTLSYIKPAEAVNTFTQIIGQFGAFGSIAAVPNASAVVITENTSLIRRLIELKTEIDKPGSVQGTRFIKVKYSDVTELADTLTTLLTAQASTQRTAGIQRIETAPAPAAGGVPAAGGQATGGGGSGEDIPIQIIPDPRTNRIVAMGRPIDLITVESLVREFDVETSEKNFLRRKLRFLTVSEFLPVAEDALTRAFSGTGGSGGSGGATQGGATGGSQGASRTQSGSSSGRQSGSGRTGSTGANFGGSGSSGGFGGGSSGGSGGGDALDAPEVSSAPESVLVGRTLLVADNITNSIVVQGPPSGLEIIERLLDQIDVKPEQVMISTVIGQLTLNNSKEFGLDYLVRSGDISARGGGGFGSILPITPIVGDDGVETGFDPGSLSGAGLRAYGTIGDLSVYLRALQSKTDFTVLSRPSIFTSNNQKGTISSGERIAIPTSNNNFSGGGSSTNIEYQDVVLKLEVIPLVNSDNEITMKIALLNDEQNGNQIIQGAGGDGGDLSVPRISTREVLTTATVPNGQTIVLGGLIVGRNSQEKSGIPILSDIPYLGKLFGTTTNTDDRSELMVFIQPSVVNNDRSLGSVQADMDSRYKASPRVRDFADGPGVLPPVDAIAPVEDKGMSRTSSNRRQSPSVAPAAEPKTPAKAKPVIRSSPNR
ncbi:MAG: secretin N-terminal domain-containing protein [Luteolibacter sp.]